MFTREWDSLGTLRFQRQRWTLRVFWGGLLMARRQICPVQKNFCQDRGMIYDDSRFWCTREFVVWVVVWAGFEFLQGKKSSNMSHIYLYNINFPARLSLFFTPRLLRIDH